VVHVIQCMEVWGGNLFLEEEVQLPGLTGYVLSRPRQGRIRGDIFLLSVCASNLLAKITVIDTYNRGNEFGLLSQEIRRLMATYGSEPDNYRMVRSIARDPSRYGLTGKEIKLTAATFNSENRCLIYAYLRDPQIVARRASSARWEVITKDRDTQLDAPLGPLPASEFEQYAVRFDENDWILFFTSGLLNVLNPGDQPGAHEILIDRLGEIETSDPASLVKELTLFPENSAGHPGWLDHDIMVLALKVAA